MFKQNLCFERKKMVNFLKLAKIYVKLAVLPSFYHIKKHHCAHKDKGAFFIRYYIFLRSLIFGRFLSCCFIEKTEFFFDFPNYA